MFSKVKRMIIAMALAVTLVSGNILPVFQGNLYQVDAAEKLSESGLNKWLNAEVLKKTPEVTKKAKKAITKSFSEDEFFAIWKASMTEKIKELSMDPVKTAVYVRRYCLIYNQIYKSGGNHTDEIKALQSAYAKIYEAQGKIKSITMYYSFDITDDSLFQVGDFKISKLLKNYYEDNLAGKAKKEIESYEENDAGTEWLAYGTYYDNILGIRPDYDAECVFYSREKMPFKNSSGIYTVTYVDLNRSKGLQNDKGFEFDVPLYEMIDETVMNDAQEVKQLKETMQEPQNEILRQLGIENQVEASTTVESPVDVIPAVDGYYVTEHSSLEIMYETGDDVEGGYIICYADSDKTKDIAAYEGVLVEQSDGTYNMTDESKGMTVNIAFYNGGAKVKIEKKGQGNTDYVEGDYELQSAYDYSDAG